MSWHYFVECDDAVHRIYQLPPLKEEIHGIHQFMSSQWFISSREFAEYLAKEESLAGQYLAYAEHVVVCDEAFFGTVLTQSRFCGTLHNSNLLQYTFDR